MTRLLWLLPALLLAACEEQEPVALGLLMSDRVELVADVAEPITSIAVQEGQELSAGQILLQQDIARIDAQLTEAQAGFRRIEALLSEQLRGPREEQILAAQAALRQAELQREYSETEWRRQLELDSRGLGTRELLDQARLQMDLAGQQIAASSARLAELEAGTTAEELDQTRQHLFQLQAQIERLEIERQRHSLIAPVNGRLDSLLFETGEQPAAGDVVAVLLTGLQPHARVYVPAAIRVNVQAGDRVEVRIDGIPDPLAGVVRRISNDAAFTPYFSLNQRDRGRLSYVAEITLPETERRLPDGLPVEVSFGVSR